MKIEDIPGSVNKENQISERAAAVAQKIGAAVLIAVSAGVVAAGIVLAVNVKRRIWPNFHEVVSTLKEKGLAEKGEKL